MKKKSIRRMLQCMLILCICASTLYANSFKVSFEKGEKVNKVVVNLYLADDDLYFDVHFNEDACVKESALGLNIDNHFLGEDVRVQEFKCEKQGDYYTNATLSLQHTLSQINYFLDVRVFPDGIALRYRIPSKVQRCVYNEQTTFSFLPQTKVWYASGPFQYGWLQEYQDRDMSQVAGELIAPPATFKFPNGTYAAVTEANLFDYHGAVMYGLPDNKVGFHYVENKGQIEYGICTGLPHNKYWHEVEKDVPWIANPKQGTDEITTPWRVLMLAKDLNELVNNQILPQVSDAPNKSLFPKGAKTDWIKPSRAVFTWLVEGPNRLSIENHKKYIRGCKELGIETIIVDDGWEQWETTEKGFKGLTKWEMLKNLVDYGTVHDVNVWVWRASSPFHVGNKHIGLVDDAERKDFMKRCAKSGVKGLKIDFFHTENEFTVQLMEDILRDAAKEKLMVIFHGVNKPTGDSFTYPNLLAKEAVRGLECVGGEDSWAPGPSWPYHNTVLPFTRWLVGAADYTPLNYRKFCHPSVTFTHQLASIYMFTSPMLIFAADMDDMLSCPGRQFIEDVPVEWDETRVLPESKIGEIAVLARRKGTDWYVTAMNGDEPKTLDIALDFLPKGKYQMLMAYDAPNNRKQIKIRKQTIRTKQRITESLLSGGAVLIKFTAKR